MPSRSGHECNQSGARWCCGVVALATTTDLLDVDVDVDDDVDDDADVDVDDDVDGQTPEHDVRSWEGLFVRRY